MNFIVTDQIKLETSKGVFNLSSGQIITLDPEKAIKLIETGKIKPVNDPNYFLPDINQDIIKKVKAIEQKALSLGWKPEQLWNKTGWYNKRGLISSLTPDNKIGEVTDKYIEIYFHDFHGKKIVHKYFNHEVDQKWLKHTN